MDNIINVIVEIKKELINIEKEFDIKILYACESGSRAWGFANKESDYDIRFIYIRKTSEYLNIAPLRDVIDYNDLKNHEYKYDFDFQGWDIKKALFLHWKGNPNLREHLLSPICYRGNTWLFNDLPDFDPAILKYHYFSIVKHNWNKYVIGKCNMDKRVTKRYLYAIRCILSWILINYNKKDVPINIYELLIYFEDKGLLENEIIKCIDKLIVYYQNNCLNKYSLSEREIQILSSFIDYYINIMKTDKPQKRDLPNIEIYNNRFKTILSQSDIVEVI